MKGVYSSVDGVMDRATLHSLYPDTSYSYESGGNPDNIPELSYEEYLDFHRKYYHPSNSYIYLYGDMDMVERLRWIDKEYLGKYDMLKIDSEVKKQPAFLQLKEEKVAYAITDSESLEDNTVLTVNYVIGDSSDVELNTAIQVLEYVLMEMPGAFLKQALIDAKIGKDVYSQYEDDICQPMYSIVAKYANESDKEKFITIINETLEKLAKEGLDKKALLAGLNSLEFKVRESDFGRIPKGLIFGINMLSSWLYDDSNPFVLLETNKVFEKLRKMIDTDYFEKLITEYFIKNTHKSVVILTPEKGLTEKKEQQLKDSLEAKKGTMTDEEIENIIRETKELKEYQTTSSSPEDLAKIPLLEIEDIGKEPRKIIGQSETKEGITMLYNDLFTNGIGYLDIVFDCTDLPEKYQSYMGLLKPVLSYMDTEKHSYTELNTEIDLDLGGFAFDSGIYVNKKTGEPMLTGEVHAKMLYDKIPKTFDLIKEVVLETKFDDYKRLKEILEELKSSIIKTGDSAAMLRAMSYYSKSYYLKEQSTGLAFYQFLSDILDNYEEKKEDFAKKLKDTIEYVFSNQKMYLNYAGDRESYELVKKLVIDLKNSVYNVPRNKDLWQFRPEKKNEAIKTSGQVQYVARTGNYNKDNDKVFSGSFMVLGNIMRSKYLWNNIRELGGAYGCNASFTRNGDVMFTSYRDPNLGKTNQVYLKAADFIENPLLTYLEPAASSTSELVTELVQYAGVSVKLSKAEATGIYAGIVLDTKNFVQQTGARTFEAAAFLRRAGADIDRVKQLFIETFDSIQLRAKMVFEASRTEGIAISVAPEGLKDMMALAAQSADMLISNEDIEAAFVLYSLNDGGIGVSARSKGKVNVQVVMEALGGGGHRTVAGAQLQGMTIEEAKQAILEHALEALHSAEQEEE